MSTASEIAFAKWIQKNDPFLFHVALKAQAMKRGVPMGGFTDFVSNINWKDIANNVVSTVKEVAPSLIQYKAQAAALKTNLARAKAGQPPINFDDYTPSVKISPVITPQTEAAINRVASQAVKSTTDKLKEALPFIAVGIGVVGLLLRRK